jgi:hypothetical protein
MTNGLKRVQLKRNHTEWELWPQRFITKLHSICIAVCVVAFEGKRCYLWHFAYWARCELTMQTMHVYMGIPIGLFYFHGMVIRSSIGSRNYHGHTAKTQLCHAQNDSSTKMRSKDYPEILIGESDGRPCGYYRYVSVFSRGSRNSKERSSAVPNEATLFCHVLGSNRLYVPHDNG